MAASNQRSSLEPLGTNLHHAEMVLKLGAGLRLPARMTVIKLTGGGVALHSPIRIDDALAAQIEALGPVRHLIAPNRFHHLYLGQALKRWPGAVVHGAPGLAEKRKDLTFASTLADSMAAPLSADFEACVLCGSPRMGEVALFHKTSRTLITTDFVFNLEEPRGLMTKLFTSLMGTRNRFAQSRLVRIVINDRAANKESAERILEWPIERVVMAHGAVVEGDAKARLRAALWWSLGEAS